MKFNRNECQVLHLERNNPIYQHRLGTNCLGGCYTEENLGCCGQEADRIQWTLVTKKQNSLLGCIRYTIANRLMEVIFPSDEHWWDTSGTLGPVMGSLVWERCTEVKGQKDEGSGASDMWWDMERAVTAQYGKEKAQGLLVLVCKYLMDVVKKTEPFLSQWCTVERQEAMTTYWNTENYI